MSEDVPGSDLMALRNKFKTAKTVKPSKVANAADRRAKLEARRSLSETDGRRKPAHEIRDVQMNFKVSAATKQRMLETARALNVPMVEIVERGLELIEAGIAKGKKG